MLISVRDIKKEFWVEDVVTNVLNGITLDIERVSLFPLWVLLAQENQP